MLAHLEGASLVCGDDGGGVLDAGRVSEAQVDHIAEDQRWAALARSTAGGARSAHSSTRCE